MTNLASAKSPDKHNTGGDLSPAVQDYLRAIYKAGRGKGRDVRVTTSELAERLGISAASVTGMLQKMAGGDMPLVDYHKHQGVLLTAAGEEAALGLVRYHRLIELFLVEKLGFAWDEVHDEADRLEHSISDALADRLDEVLGYPRFDPHGHAIPAAGARRPAARRAALAELADGATATVRSVPDEDAALLRDLVRAGFCPGARVIVLGREAGEAVRVRVVGQREPVTLRPSAAARITVDVAATTAAAETTGGAGR